MTGRLAGKVAIVTGAASLAGIGFATASRFAAEGASVLLTDIDEPAVASAADDIIRNGGNAVGVAHDVVSESSWRSVMTLAVELFSKLDILVNNAGIALIEPVASTTLDQVNRVLDVNFKGVLLGCREAIAAMQGSGGAIVNLSSVTGLIGVPRNGVYGATKGAVRMLTKTVALEGANLGIRCNSVHPGPVDTEMVRSIARKLGRPATGVLDAVPLGRAGTAEEVANMILFLASDEASYVTGAEFVVDGGLTAQ